MEIMRCEALCKTFASGETAVHAVRDISLSFDKGEFVAITRPGGSGKSTLLHTLGGQQRISVTEQAGRILLLCGGTVISDSGRGAQP